MTTLTQDTALRPDHCAHKLPSSCRLTARPTCCACQDTRPHAPVYRRYVDGLGYVMIGMRQDGYCWPCKVFWDVRMIAADMGPERTRIPFIPDQTDFINAWHDWHRGFRILISEDGVQVRQELRGQPLSQVLIGHLPDAADGSDPYDSRALKWISMPDVPEDLYPRPQEVVPVSDEDRLFDSDEESSSDQMSNEITANPSTTSEAGSQRQIAMSTSTDNSNLLPSDFFFSTTLTTLRSTSLDLENLTFSLRSESIRLQRAVSQPELLSDTERTNFGDFVDDLENVANETSRAAHILESHQELINTMRRSQQTSRPTPPYLSVSLNQNITNSTDDRQLNQTYNTRQSNAFPQTTDPQTNVNRQARNAAIAARAGAVLGTREEVQEDDYQSPLTLMFNGITTSGERSERRNEVLREQQALLGNIQRQLIRLISLPVQPPSAPLTPAQVQLQNYRNPLRTDAENGHPQSLHNIQSLPANSPEIDTIVTSVQYLVVQQLRERLAFPFDMSYRTIRDRIDQVALEYSQAMADILDNRPRRTSAGMGGIASHHPQDLVQGMLEIIYPRERGEALRTYLARIGRENTARTTNPSRPTAPVATMGRTQPNTQAPPLPATTLIETNFSQLMPGSREWHRQRAQARAILDYGNDGLSQMILERHGLVEAAASLYDPNLPNRSMTPIRSLPAAPNGSNTAGQLEPSPRPLALAETMVQLQCIVCLEQIADVALVPCGHMVMCRWCSELHEAVTVEEFGRRATATCPMCRQKIKQRLRIWGLESIKKGKEGSGQEPEDDEGDDGGEGSGGDDTTFNAT